MRPLLKLNPYLAKYRWHLMLGTVFIVLSNLFAVYAPQVVREAIDLIAQGIGQMGLPANERVLPVPAYLATVGRLDRHRSGPQVEGSA